MTIINIILVDFFTVILLATLPKQFKESLNKEEKKKPTLLKYIFCVSAFEPFVAVCFTYAAHNLFYWLGGLIFRLFGADVPPFKFSDIGGFSAGVYLLIAYSIFILETFRYYDKLKSKGNITR